MFDLAPDEDDDGPPLIEWQGMQAVPAPASKQAQQARKASKYRIMERQAKFARAQRIRDRQDDQWREVEAFLLRDEIERLLDEWRNSSESESASSGG